MTNATAFWGAADGSTGNTAACSTTVSTNALTCNGNGDGIVSRITSSDERMRYWQHLANAGLIEGQYGGVYATGGANEIPQSKLSGGVWWATNGGSQPASTTEFATDGSNEYQYYQPSGANGVVTPAEAWNINTKMDDGLPGMGKVRTWKGDATNNCTSVANSATDTGAVYSLSVTSKTCWFRLRGL